MTPNLYITIQMFRHENYFEFFLVVEERLSTKVSMKFNCLTNFSPLCGQVNYSFILMWFTNPYADFFPTKIWKIILSQ